PANAASSSTPATTNALTLSTGLSQHPLQLLGFLPGQLPADERRRNQSGVVELLHERLHRELRAELLLPLRQQLLDLDLSDDVTRPVALLLQVEVLPPPDQVPVQAEPPARRVRRGERRRLLQRELVARHAEVAQSPRGALGEQDVEQLPGPGPRVEHSGLHHELFPAGRVPL